jgi:hypothetical protein
MRNAPPVSSGVPGTANAGGGISTGAADGPGVTGVTTGTTVVAVVMRPIWLGPVSVNQTAWSGHSAMPLTDEA